MANPYMLGALGARPLAANSPLYKYTLQANMGPNGGLGDPYGDANAYRAALEKATYGQLGNDLNSADAQITGQLARSGMYDSGAAAALRARLATQLYGQAAGRVGNAYASYLAQSLAQRRAYAYQRALAKYQKSLQQTGIGGIVGGVAGGLVGSALGPFGAAAGTALGKDVFGGQ